MLFIDHIRARHTDHYQWLTRHLRELTLEKGVMRHWLDMLSKHPDNHACVVSCAEQLPLVYYGWACAFHHHESPENVYNLGVFVREDVRGRGIGEQLIERMLETLPSDGMINYSVGSPAAEKLYAKFANDKRLIRLRY